MTTILASKSPRRRELLSLILPSFEVEDAHIDERAIHGDSPSDLCQKLATAKCRHVFELHPNSCVIGCDTLVFIDNRLLGKPHSVEDAREMIRELSDAAHDVYTGVCIMTPITQEVFHCKTTVVFNPISEEEIEAYIATDEPYDKAGGYSIQGGAAKFCRELHGDFYNVMGLPVSALYEKLRSLNLI